MTTNKILLIEDNPADAHLVRYFLEETDLIRCDITHAMSLRDALDTLATGVHFDAILCDLTLPDSRGFETLERLMAEYPDSNVIVQTGLSDREIGLMAIRAGAQDFLVKGAYDPYELGKTLRYSIERRGVLDRLEETQKMARIGHWEYNLESGYITGSEELFRLLNFRPQKMSFSMEDPGEATHRLEILKKFHQETLEHGKANHEISLTNRDSSSEIIVHVKCRLSPARDAVYGMMQDITARRQNEELLRAAEVAQQAAQLKEQFLASVSHEMRTPMNAILGMSNLVLHTELNTEQKDYISSIKQSSEILLGIVNDILEVSAMQNGEVAFSKKTIDLHSIMSNLMDMMRYKMQEKEIEIGMDVAASVPRLIVGDPLRLNQILVNLMGNALKFTEKGQVKVIVQALSMDTAQARLRFEVHDTGIGIPKSKLEAIFESFTRVVHKDKLYEGTGLGLSIARNLVVQQGGKIWAESEVGVGSTFFVELPCEIARDEHIETPKSSFEERFFNADMPFHVLLVEDHKMNQIVARKTLEKRFPNISITLAENGQEAVDKISNSNHGFDLVLMDIQMPILNGIEATKLIRDTLFHAKDLPILAMTAHAHIAQENVQEKYGMDDFVLKPFEPEQLFEKIGKFVGVRV